MAWFPFMFKFLKIYFKSYKWDCLFPRADLLPRRLQQPVVGQAQARNFIWVFCVVNHLPLVFSCPGAWLEWSSWDMNLLPAHYWLQVVALTLPISVFLIWFLWLLSNVYQNKPNKLSFSIYEENESVPVYFKSSVAYSDIRNSDFSLHNFNLWYGW